MITPKKLPPDPLPETQTIRLTFICPISLKANLGRYVSLHAQTYGKPLMS